MAGERSGCPSCSQATPWEPKVTPTQAPFRSPAHRNTSSAEFVPENDAKSEAEKSACQAFWTASKAAGLEEASASRIAGLLAWRACRKIIAAASGQRTL